MKELFFRGGPEFMSVLTILFVITTAWIIYHFIIAYTSKQTNKEELLRRIGYGKSMGLFTLTIGVLGQLIGFTAMFEAIEELIATGGVLMPHMVFGAIKVTMIITMYGILIYLFSFILWFIASLIIEKKFREV